MPNVTNPNAAIDLTGGAGAANTNAAGGAGTTPLTTAETIATIFNQFGSTARSSANADLQKAKNLFNEHIEENKLTGYEVIVVNNQQTGNYGALVLCKSVVTGSQKALVIHTAMVEKSKQTEQQNHQLSFGAQNYEVYVSVGDAYTQQYASKVADVVRKNFPDATTIVDGGWSIIYRDTVLEKDDFQPFIAEAMIAIEHGLYGLRRQRAIFSLDMLKGESPIRVRSQLSIDQYTKSPAGQPIRSDITSDIVLTQTTSKSATGGVDESSEMSVCRLSSYVDLIYVPQQQPFFGFGNFVPQQQPLTPSFIPRINITNIVLNTPASSLEFLMLAIASQASLAKNRSYGVVWRDNFGAVANQNRNLGGIGTLLPQLTTEGKPGILDVNGDIRQLYTLMSIAVSENPVFTIELTQGGQSNWVTTIFTKIAKGDLRQQELLIKACDNLTGERFTPIYNSLCAAAGNGLQPILSTNNEPSLAGTYRRDGELRDIREVDLLAIANKWGVKDPDLLNGYLTTFASQELLQVRLDRRQRILKSIEKDVVFRAYTQKYDLGGIFIQALTKAIEASGVNISNDNFANTNESVYSQSISQWQAYMVNPAAVAGFNQQPMTLNNGWSVGNIFV